MEWISKTAAGPRGIPGPPGSGTGTPAPNVTGTAAWCFKPVDYGQVFGFSGVITLPTTDPNYSHLKQIDVVGVAPDGNRYRITFLRNWSGSSISYIGYVGSQPSTNQTWSIEFQCFNENSVLTASPYIVASVTVYAPAISSLLGSEVPDARYQDAEQGLHMVISYTVSLANAQYPQFVRFWQDFNDGRGYVQQPDFQITASAQVIRIGDPVSVQGQQQPGDIWVPAPGQTAWKVKAQCLAGGAYVENSFTVTAVGQCLSDDITEAQFNPNPASGDILNYAVTSPGIYWWDYYQLQFKQPTLSKDPNYWFTFVSVQLGRAITGVGTVSGSGTTFTQTSGSVPFTSSMVGEDIHVAGVLTTIAGYSSPTVVTLANAQPLGSGKTYEVWQRSSTYEGNDESSPYMLYRGRLTKDSGQYQGKISVPGTYCFLNGDQPANWTIPPDKNSDGSPNLYRTYRFRLYCVSHINDTALGNSTGFSFQTSAWPANADGSMDHFDVSPLVQPPALDLTQAAVYGLGDGMTGGAGLPVKPNLTDPLTLTISKQITLAQKGVSTQYIADAANTARTMAANAVTQANSALAANSVVDANINDVGVPKLTAGTQIFTGDVVLSRGSTRPVVVLGSGGLYLYSVASGSTGLTSSPYVVIQSGGISLFSGGNASVTLTSSSINLWSVNGNTSNPYVSLSSSSLNIVSGNFVTQFTASTITMQYAGSLVSLTMTSLGIILSNGTCQTKVESTGITLTNGGTSKIEITTGSGVVITNATFSLALNGVTTTIANQFAGSLFNYVGLKCVNTSGIYSVVGAGVVGCVDPGGYQATMSAIGSQSNFGLSGPGSGSFSVSALSSELFLQMGFGSTLMQIIFGTSTIAWSIFGLPTSRVSGNVWVDTSAGNVLKLG
jgi:hypothetical protein